METNARTRVPQKIPTRQFKTITHRHWHNRHMADALDGITQA